MRVAALLFPVALLAEECHVIVREREKAGRGWHSTHFWHLMMADFLPTVAHVARRGCASVRVASWRGRRWDSPIERRVWRDLEDHAPGDGGALRVHLETGADACVSPSLNGCAHYVSLRAWDWAWPRAADAADACAAARWLAARAARFIAASRDGGSEGGAADAIVQVRGATPAAETAWLAAQEPGGRVHAISGAERRSSRDFARVGDVVRAALGSRDGDAAPLLRVAVHVPNSTQHLYAQIATYARASVLVLEHGAGMFLAWFLPAAAPLLGGRAPPLVVEVINPSQAAELNGATQGLARLAQARAAGGGALCVARVVLRAANGDALAQRAEVELALDRWRDRDAAWFDARCAPRPPPPDGLACPNATRCLACMRDQRGGSCAMCAQKGVEDCDACACPPVAFDFARWDADGAPG